MTAAFQVSGWLLAALALALLLVAPNANGPFLVLVWGVALAGFRYVASMTPDRAPRLILGATFVWASFLGAFWGGWFLIPAGIAFLVMDWRAVARGIDPRLLAADVLAAAASAVSGLVALALLVESQSGARTRGPANVAPDGTPVYENLADLAAMGPPTDWLDLVVVLAAVLCGILIVAAVVHAQNGSRLAFLAMCASVLGLATFAGLASLSAGWWFMPSIALGVVACVAGWHARRRGSGRPTSGGSGAAKPAI